MPLVRTSWTFALLLLDAPSDLVQRAVQVNLDDQSTTTMTAPVRRRVFEQQYDAAATTLSRWHIIAPRSVQKRPYKARTVAQGLGVAAPTKSGTQHPVDEEQWKQQLVQTPRNELCLSSVARLDALRTAFWPHRPSLRTLLPEFFAFLRPETEGAYARAVAREHDAATALLRRQKQKAVI